MNTKDAQVEQAGVAEGSAGNEPGTATATGTGAGAEAVLQPKDSKDVFYDVEPERLEDKSKTQSNPLGVELNQVPGAAAAMKSKEAAAAATAAVLQQKEAMEGRIARLPMCLQCLLCCCCWTGTGLLDMLTDEETIQFALGFIIGEAFGSMVNSVVSNLVSPIVVVLGVPSTAWTLAYRNGQLIIANPGALAKPDECNIEDTSFDLLVQDCDVVAINLLGQNGLLTDLLQFVIIMVTVYWIVNGLRSARDRKFLREKQDAPEEKQCVMCMKMIHMDARRCPHCTSFQDPKDAAQGQALSSSMLEISTEIQELKYLLLKKL